MELFGSKIKKILMFSQKEVSLYFRIFFFLYFRKWNFLALILKNFRKRKPQKKFLIFQETEIPERLFIFWEMKLYGPPIEKFLYFRKRKPRKNFLYFLKRKLFLYFWKWNQSILLNITKAINITDI